MASLLSGLIVPTEFSQYVAEVSVVKNALIKCGVIVNDPMMSNMLATAGDGANILTFKNLDQNGTQANVSSTDPTVLATPETITGRKQKFQRLARNKVFQSANFSASLLGTDPMAAIANDVAAAVIQWRQASLLSVLQGTINATVAAGNVNVVSVETLGYASTNQINVGTITDTLGLWGDFGVRDMMVDVNAATVILCHSDTLRYMMKSDIVSFQRPSTQIGYPTYLGMPVFTDDTLPKRAGTTSGHVYTTYFVKPGGIHFGSYVPKNATATFEAITAGNGAGVDQLVQRDEFAYHIPGFSFTGTYAADNPTNTEMATPGNWTQILLAKQTGVLALQHNLLA